MTLLRGNTLHTDRHVAALQLIEEIRVMLRFLEHGRQRNRVVLLLKFLQLISLYILRNARADEQPDTDNNRHGRQDA